MSDHHLALSPVNGDGATFLDRLFQLINLVYENSIEFLLSILTKKSQLERILDSSAKTPASQMSQLEMCLRKQGTLKLKKMFRRENDSEEMLRAAAVKADGDHRDILKQRLEQAIRVFDAYEALCEQVEASRLEKYDSSNQLHEEKLAELWSLLMPHEELEDRLGKQWRHIGFQGDDPATDFRGMGVLSLDQLIFMSSNHKEAMNSILSLSHHPQIGFPMAVAGITMTSLTRHLLIVGRLKKHFYNISHERDIDMETFHHSYCRIFILFCEYWKRENPPSVMSFNLVRMSFERSLADALLRDDVNLMTLTVEEL